MGVRGPAPKPDEVKRLEGNKGHEKNRKRPPKFSPKVPACPDWLDDLARKEWARIGPELGNLAMLTAGDLAAFACYCKAYSDLQQAEAVIQEKGHVFETATGYVMPRPEVAMANTAMKQVKDFAIQFGFTPSARSRIDLTPKDDGGDEDLD